MTNEKEHYVKELDTLRYRVRHCDNAALVSLTFFMEEANTHMAGISDDVVKDIKYEVTKFKENCSCGEWMSKY